MFFILLPLCFIFYEVNYIILVYIIIKIFYQFYMNNLTLEDQYQIDINKKNKTKKSLIYVLVKYSDQLYFDNIIKNLNEKLSLYVNNYNSIQDYKKIWITKDNYVYYDKKLFLEEEDYHYKFFIDKDSFKIHAYINHELIGGSYLLTLFYSFLNTPQKSPDILFPKSSIFNLFYSLKLILNYKNIPKIEKDFLSLVNHKDQIKRYKNKYSIEKNTKFRSKTIILYNIMKTLHTCLNLKRPLICYLPIAFQNFKNVKNNIGLMWLSFEEKDTPETIEKKIYDTRYQILATNSLLLYKSNNKNISSKVRKSVDAVISFMIGAENSDIDVSWTFENISEYPIYVSITSIMKENCIDITQTLTCSTFKFDNSKCKNFQEVLFENYKI